MSSIYVSISTEAQHTMNVSIETPIKNEEKKLELWTPAYTYITIGGSILGIIIIGTTRFVLRRKCFTRKSPNNYDEQKVLSSDRIEEIELTSPATPEPPATTSPEDHIYEEIPDRGDTYDHLRHGPQPMPIPTDNIYHNFLLLNDENRNNSNEM